MPIDWATYRKIRAMHMDGMSDHKIAKKLGVGRRTVAKYRDGGNIPVSLERRRASPIREAIEAELLRMLKENAALPKKQRLSAHGMWEELMNKGYIVSDGHTRKLVQELRATGGEEFIPLHHEKGAVLEIDWLDAVAIIAGVKTEVSVFVAVLPYSGAIFSFAYPDKTNISFFHGHISAFNAIGGVASQCKYDNLRSAVLSDYGKKANKQIEFMRLEAHYGFEAIFCNIEAGWEKSNVENGVKITRRKCFSPIPRVDSWAELQKHIDVCLLKYNKTHKIQGEANGIWENYQSERGTLMPLPLSPMDPFETSRAKVRHDQTVAYDGARYSVPHGYVGMDTTLRVSPFEIEVFYRGNLLCTHQRLRTKGESQYILEHYLDALSRKPRAIDQALPIIKGQMPPQCRAFLETCPAKDAKRQLVSLMLLAREIGAECVLRAMDEAQKTGCPTADLVKLYLDIEVKPGSDIAIEHAQLSLYDMLIDGTEVKDGNRE